MKHTKKVTAILLGMFILTQIIGLAVINAYTNQTLPYGMQPPEKQEGQDANFLYTVIIAFIIAISLVFLLTKFRVVWFLRLWFFLVVVLAIGLSIYAFEILVPFEIPYTLALILPVIFAVPLAFFKIFKQNLIVHNLTELLIYPGIAAVFVPILSVWTIIILLLLISAYDIWAVWHSGFMQKMAKFQINELKIFAGFFVPYADKKTKEKIRQIKMMKGKLTQKQLEKRFKDKKIKINLGILGGGDVVFPLIMAGVVFRALGLIPASFTIAGASFALLVLQLKAKKGKFYPAMPFLSAGCFFGFIVGLLLSLI